MKVAFWLVPAPADRAFFQEIINALAQSYGAPIFTPHVTLYSGEFESDTLFPELIQQTTSNLQPLSLQVDRLCYTEQFTKTVFVQFRPEPILSNLTETLRDRTIIPSCYKLDPHLSLIYQQLSPAEQQQIIAQLSLPQSRVQFDEVRAIAIPEKTQTKKDVERWQVLAVQKLPKINRAEE